MVGLVQVVVVSGTAWAGPDASLVRMEQDLRWLVEELGPRPSGSRAELRAAQGVQARLAEAGWASVDVGPEGNQVACRGRPDRLFLAHVDTVPESPGAVDNGAAVAVLLELARDEALSDLCVGFPVQEELGLVGSRVMAEAAQRGVAPFSGGLPALVVSMELVGQGELALMGLGPQWGDARLAWLDHSLEPLPRVPLPYRIYSRHLPWAERSDHGPFGLLGVPALLVLGQGAGEVYPRYHQPSDTAWEGPALVATLQTLRQLAVAPLPPGEGAAAPWARPEEPLGAGVFVWGWRLPSAVVFAVLGLALLSGAVELRHRRHWRELPRQLGTGLLGAAIGGLLMAGLARGGLLESGAGEAAARDIFGLPASGWWTAAPVATVLGLAGLLGTARLLGPRGSAPLAGALCTALAWLVGPVFALPFAAGALLSRLHPWAALLPVLVLLRPDGLRQLAFHGLLPPVAWGLVLVLGWPAVGRWVRVREPRKQP
jgi:hypothetical protein